MTKYNPQEWIRNSAGTVPFLHQGGFVAASKANRAKGFASKEEEAAYIQSLQTSLERRRGGCVQASAM